MNEQLEQARRDIDRCDRDLIQLLERRLSLAEEVARIKEMESRVSLTDAKREEDLIRNLLAETDHMVLRSEIPSIFGKFMEMSKRVRIIRHQKEKNRYLPSLDLGIIGLGHFGTLLKETFGLHWPQSQLFTFDASAEDQEALKNCCQADLLFLCVPISSLENCLETIKPLLNEKTTVIDVCTVKMYSEELMSRILGTQRMIASHPMFGPESTKQGTDFIGLSLVSHNLSAPAFIYEVFTQFWDNLGVQIIELTPEEHDRFAAYSINYNHLVGRIGERIGLRSTPIDTKGFKVVYEAMHYVTHDTWQLFRDMQVFNPFASEMRKKVLKAVHDIDKKLEP